MVNFYVIGKKSEVKRLSIQIGNDNGREKTWDMRKKILSVYQGEGAEIFCNALVWALIHLNVIRPLSGSCRYGVLPYPFEIRDVKTKHCFCLCITTPYLFISDERGNVTCDAPISIPQILLDEDGMFKKTLSDEEFYMAFMDGLTLSKGDGAIKVLSDVPTADYMAVVTGDKG